MASSDDALETYTHLPIQIDPQSKLVSAASSDKSIQDAVASINAIHALMKGVDTPNHAPPPPMPVNPKRSAQIAKLRETATQNLRKGQIQDALRILGLAIDMASGRPAWEPVGLVKEEMALCYLDRSNAYIFAQKWVEGFKDAECSTECKKGPQTLPNGQRTPGNPKAWLAGAKCLVEMARRSDAVRWIQQGLDVEDNAVEEIPELKRMLAKAQAQVGGL